MIKPFTRRHWLVAAALFTCVIVLGASRMAPGVSGVYHDDGIYVATGKAIAEGKGYHLINLPGEPPQTKYPFLYPAVLSVFWKMWPAFPDNLALLQGFSLLCSAMAIAISFLYLVRFGYFSDTECAIAGIICATSPSLLYFSTQTLSEPFFAVLLTCGLWMGDEVMTRRAPGSRRENWVAGVIIALPFLCRVIAAPIAVLCAVLVAWRKRSIWVLVGAACAHAAMGSVDCKGAPAICALRRSDGILHGAELLTVVVAKRVRSGPNHRFQLVLHAARNGDDAGTRHRVVWQSHVGCGRWSSDVVFDHRGVEEQDSAGDISPGVCRTHLVLAMAACALPGASVAAHDYLSCARLEPGCARASRAPADRYPRDRGDSRDWFESAGVWGTGTGSPANWISHMSRLKVMITRGGVTTSNCFAGSARTRRRRTYWRRVWTPCCICTLTARR